MAAANGFSFLAFVMIILSFSAISAESRDLSLDRNVPNKWCVAIPGAAAYELQQDLGIICGQVDCSTIQPSGACFAPNSVESHAIVALNLYYKAHSAQASACGLPGSMLTLDDPSFGNCRFP